MGSSSSKVAKSAAGAVQRRYPTRLSSPATTQQTSPLAPSAERPPPHQQSIHGTRDPARSQAQAAQDRYATSNSLQPATRASRPPPPPPEAQRQASSYRDQGIDLDGRDPQLAAHLRTIGPVQPNPTYSPSSTSSPSNTANDSSTSGAPRTMTSNPATTPSPRNNPALAILAARQRIQDEEERDKVEAGKSGWKGRRYVDVGTLRKALLLRDEQGMKVGEIERTLDLREGFMAGLGRQGVFEAT